MKILQLTGYFFPEKVSSIHLTDSRLKAFEKAGFKSIIYAPTPCRGLSKEEIAEYKKRKHEYMYEGSLEIYRFSMFIEGKNPILRAFRYALCWIVQLWKGMRTKNIDCVYLASTPPIQGILGSLLTKIKKVPFVYNLQDIFPDSLVGTGLAKKGGLLWKIGRVIENFTYKHADKIIVIGEDFKRNIMEKGVPESKIEVVYNWVDEDSVMPIAKEENPLFDEFGICREKFNVVYAGNLGNAQGIDVIIDAAKELEMEKNIVFLIFGTGGLKEQFVQKVKDYDLDNVKFFPLQPIKKVSQVYGLGDVCVVTCKPGLGGAAMPSKMVSIMSAGRAVAASFDEGELTYILKHNKCGLYAPAGDVSAFAKLIKDMAANPRQCKVMGENARALILKKFTREYGTSRYIEIIRSVVNNIEG